MVPALGTFWTALARACFVSACLVLIVYCSYGTRAERETLPALPTANRIRANKMYTSVLLDLAESFCTRILTKGLLEA